jgi:hypothetical protein
MRSLWLIAWTESTIKNYLSTFIINMESNEPCQFQTYIGERMIVPNHKKIGFGTEVLYLIISQQKRRRFHKINCL